MITKIKICGIRRREDIDLVNYYKPDYIGFIFYEQSKRYIDMNTAKELISNLDTNIKTVGVFVNEDVNTVNSISDFLGLNVIQLHGEESSDYIEKLNNKKIWKAIIVKNDFNFETLDKYKVTAFLFDTLSIKGYGGTGEVFDWSILKNLNTKYKIILAGGINKDNIISAIEAVKPFCIDVSSGVELNGYKNKDMLKSFFEALKV